MQDKQTSPSPSWYIEILIHNVVKCNSPGGDIGANFVQQSLVPGPNNLILGNI